MSFTTNTVYTASSLITMHPSEPSICIPRLFMNIQKERVYDVFADLFGRNAIERVDMIERKNYAGEEYKRAFVHFKSWPRTEQATEVRLKLLNSDEVKIMYDQPWFWRISASRVPRPEDVRRRETRDEIRPFIVIDESDTKDTRRAPYQPRQQHTQGHRDERRQHQHRPQEQRHQERYDERRDQRDYHRSQPRHQERYDERSSYNRRLDSRRPPSIHITPTKTAPEIADWIEKSKQVPGAPVKSKKPRLVMSDEGGAGADDVAEGERTTDVKNRPRKLSFDEVSSDDEAVPRVAPTPSTPPVPQQPQSSET